MTNCFQMALKRTDIRSLEPIEITGPCKNKNVNKKTFKNNEAE